jgi:polo-like kinase 4
VVHRDLKLSNILIASRSDSLADQRARQEKPGKLVIKVCDFGLAVLMGHPDEEHFTLCGTPNYIAPEIAAQVAHGYPADIWSAGCLFYSMVVGRYATLFPSS